MSPRPVVLMVDGRVIEAVMRRAGVTDDDLRQRLRLAGITARTQVRLAVLECTGQMSVMAAAAGECEPWMHEDLPRSLELQ
nr:YetF domain-containing protein [Pseudonocardia oceani]